MSEMIAMLGGLHGDVVLDNYNWMGTSSGHKTGYNLNLNTLFDQKQMDALLRLKPDELRAEYAKAVISGNTTLQSSIQLAAVTNRITLPDPKDIRKTANASGFSLPGIGTMDTKTMAILELVALAVAYYVFIYEAK